jgi:hypothetical protein
MTCFMISQGGEPVALVSDIGMARAITQCQPWGEYLVEPLEVGEPIPARPSRVPRPSTDHGPARAARRVKQRPAGWTQGIPPAAIDRAVHHAP